MKMSTFIDKVFKIMGMVESKMFCFITNSNQRNLPLFIVLHQTLHSQDIMNYNNPLVQDKPR